MKSWGFETAVLCEWMKYSAFGGRRGGEEVQD